MPVTYRYSNHRLIHASSLGSAHSRLIVVKPHYIHESLAHSCLIVHGSLMPHDIHESLAHSCLIVHGSLMPHDIQVLESQTKGWWRGGDPEPASLDWERMVDPLLLLLGGGTTGVCTVAD